MSRFDRYTWRPEICNTAKDIYRILTSLDTKNKKIKRIVPIGMAENMKRDGYEWKYREILLGIGMTNEQLQSYSASINFKVASSRLSLITRLS